MVASYPGLHPQLFFAAVEPGLPLAAFFAAVQSCKGRPGYEATYVGLVQSPSMHSLVCIHYHVVALRSVYKWDLWLRLTWQMSTYLAAGPICTHAYSLVSFLADFSPSVGKSTSGNPTIPFRFKCTGMLAQCNLTCDVT